MDLYKARVVEPLSFLSSEERRARIREAGFNLYRLDSRAVTIDLLTDSGTCALSTDQAAAMMHGDESYAGSQSFRRFEAVVRETFGFPFLLPTHQGRAAERLLMECLLTPGDYVPGNYHFETTRANMLDFGARPVDFPSDAFWDFSSPSPFKGNVDVDELSRFLTANRDLHIPFLLVTITNNTCGDQPVSLSNLEGVAQLAGQHGIPLYLDACRFAQNAWFIQQREPGYQDHSIPSIVRDMFALADGCIFSAKKDGLAHMGGFLATRSATVAAHAEEVLLLREGYVTYGGITGRDLEIISTGLGEVLTEEHLQERAASTEYLLDRLLERDVPALQPAGGHAVYLDVARILPHLCADDMPAQAFAIELYIEHGIRSTRIALHKPTKWGRGAMEFVRLALPARVYTRSHLDYVANAVSQVMRRSLESPLPGLRVAHAPKLLSGFLARYEMAAIHSGPVASGSIAG